MNKQRKTSHILNVFQYDADGHVVLPASLALGIAPTGEDNSGKVPTTAWVRSIVGGAVTAYAPTSRTITINGTSYDLSSNRAWSIDTGVMTASAGLGISLSVVNQNLNIVNTGILTASSGAGISLSVVNQNLNVVNTGILTASAGLGISLSVVNQNLNVINTGILTASAGSGISLSVVDQNLNVINTGVLTASAGAGISLSIVGGNLNVVNTITNNNQLTNGAGYITSSALTGYATETYVGTAISNLVDAAPGTLDTLNELAAALGDDPNFATTVSTSIGTKVPQARTITINGTSYDLTANRSWTINSMVYPSAGIALSTGTAWGTSITDNSANWNTAYGWGNHASGGYLTGITSTQVTNALGYTPYNSTNPSGYITGITSSNVTTALGYTPYNNSNPSGYISSYTETSTLANVTARGATTSTETTYYGGLRTRKSQTAGNYTTAALWTESYDNTATGIAFHISGVKGTFLEMRTNQVLYWDGNTIYHSGNLTNLNQLTNGPGYITSYTETDTLNSVTSRGSTTSNAVTVGLLIAQGPGGNYNENVRLPGSTAVISFNTSGATGAGSYNIVSQTNFQIRNSSGTQVFVMDQSGNLTMTGTVSAPTFSGSLSGNASTATNSSQLGGYGPNQTGGANTIVQRDSNGYIQNSYFYTSGGGSERGTGISYIAGFNSGDYYIRSYTLQGLASAMSGVSMNISGNATTANGANGNFYIDDNYGNTVVGVYTSTRYQGVFAMGDAYKLPADGTTTGSLYGLAWSHPNAGGVAGNLNTHGLLVMENGTFLAAVSGSIRARDDMRAPIFYDSNDTAYYLNPAGGSRLRNLYVGDSGDDWSDPGGWGTQVRFSNGPHVKFVLHARTPGIEAGMYVHTPGSVFIGSYTGHSVNMMVGGNSRLLIEDARVYSHVYMEAAGSMRAPIFYDSNDTGYYVDPNGVSNLSALKIPNASSYTSLRVGIDTSSRIYADDNRKAIAINADYYPALHLNAYNGTNTTHGAYIVMSGTLSAGGYRLWTMGIANYNPGIFSIGYSDLQDGNGHYGIGDAWSGNDAHHGRLIVDTSGNTKIRGMLYINGTSGGISAGSPVIHAGNIGSQSVNYASSSGTTSQRSFDYLYASSYLESGGAVYGTIFYDNNDRGYYLDPNTSGTSLRIAGNIHSDGSFGSNGYSSSSPNVVSRVFAPKGAAFSSDGSTGAIRIKLPFRGNNPMWTMKVRIYNYSTNQTSEYLLGNYAYDQGGYNSSATFIGGSNAPVHTVRFGNQDGVDCVWIGETNTGWSYPVVSVLDFTSGFRASDAGSQGTGWNISIVTSFGTIGTTINPDVKFSGLSAYSIQGTSNVAGTGSASYHPSGIYSTGTNWLYGTMYLNGNTVYDVNEIHANIFYDRNDTSYYLDPNSTSRLHSLITHYTRNIHDVATDHPFGLYFSNSFSDYSYAIYRQTGSWSHPYPDLHIAFHTGIKIGAYYGYNGTRFYNNSDWATITASVNDGDNHFRGYYDIIAYASDKRLKHNIQVIDNAIDKVMKLTGMTYQWNNVGSKHGWEPDTETREAGVFAQEVQEVLPEAVKLAPFDNNMGVSKSGENFLTVKYEKIVPLLIEAIKEQQKQIEELQNKLDNVLSSR
jgi:hypothetical protein